MLYLDTRYPNIRQIKNLKYTRTHKIAENISMKDITSLWTNMSHSALGNSSCKLLLIVDGHVSQADDCCWQQQLGAIVTCGWTHEPSWWLLLATAAGSYCYLWMDTWAKLMIVVGNSSCELLLPVDGHMSQADDCRWQQQLDAEGDNAVQQTTLRQGSLKGPSHQKESQVVKEFLISHFHFIFGFSQCHCKIQAGLQAACILHIVCDCLMQ